MAKPLSDGVPYNEFAYMEYRGRFHKKVQAVDNPDPLAGSSWKYDSDEAREARIALIERQRRIESTPPHLLAYDEFLDSLYWVWLSDWMKYAADYRCQSCGIRPRAKHRCALSFGEGLNVHHKTYAHRGFEYPDHLDDLEVLCRACHSRKHGIKE
jgi:hypothetical protein